MSTPDNRVLFVANQGIEKRLHHSVVVDSSGRHAYVTNFHGNDVAVLDLKTLTVVAGSPLRQAERISFSPTKVESPGPLPC